MVDIVEQTLRKMGPCVSTALVAALIKDFALTPVNARQKVSRSTSIKKLAFIKFPRNARFLYLQSDYASPIFWTALVRNLIDHSVAYGGALACLLARGGVMPLAHFEIACGAPLAQKGHLSPAKILQILLASKLVQQCSFPGVGECIELGNQRQPGALELAKMRARLRVEEILLGAIRDWARDLGLVSYQKVALRDQVGEHKQPRVGTFSWDLTGPSYLAPMVQWSDSTPKPGFLACDILLGTNVLEQYLRPFINKCKTLRNLRNVGRCLHLFVADGYDREAFALAKKEGIIPATTETLFGKEIAKSLVNLANLLSDISPQAENLEKLDEIFTNLSHIEGAAVNLRGTLFEYLVAEFIRTSDAHSYIRMNDIVRDEQGQFAEVDVLVGHHNQSVRFIECKGYKPGGTVSDADIERWLNNRIPLIRRSIVSNPYWQNCEQVFEFWTTGRISPESRALVEAKQSEIRKFTIQLIEGDELRTMVEQSNNTPLKKTFRQHFFDHPLEKAGKAVEKRKRRTAIPRTAFPQTR